MKINCYLFNIIVFMTVSMATYAATNLPYEAEGIINGIDYDNGQAVISDSVMSIPIDIIIHKNSTTRVGIKHLKSDTNIGYNVKNNLVTEIWILNRAPIDHSVNDD